MLLKPSEKNFTAEVPEIGTFVFKYPTLMDELQIDSKMSSLLAGNSTPSITAVNIAYQMALLAHVTVKAPEEWKLEDLYSDKQLDAVYKEYLRGYREVFGEDEASDSNEGGTEGEDSKVLVSSEILSASE